MFRPVIRIARTATLAVVVALIAIQSARADFELGQQAWDKGKVEVAVAQWQAAADKGDRQAMSALGRLYAKGLGVLQDLVEAHKWLNLAASRGEEAALAERDALVALMTSAELTKARQQAEAWRLVAIETDDTQDARADFELGQQAWDKGKVEVAVAQWQAAADKGDRQAMSALGRLYAKGLGVLQDLVEAHKWLNLAASRGEEAALAERDALVALMTSAELTKARQQAEAWRLVAIETDDTQESMSVAILHRAAQVGNIEVLTAALESGVDVDARDGRGWTALMHAVNQGSLSSVDLLLEAGANEYLRAPDGATALLMAVVFKHTEVVFDRTDIVAKQRKDIVAKLMNASVDYPFWSRYGDNAWKEALNEGTTKSFETYLIAYPSRYHTYDAIWVLQNMKKAREREEQKQQQAREQEELARKWPSGKEFYDCDGCPKMVVLPAGLFMMGSPEWEDEQFASEWPMHEVTIPKPFAVGVYEVTVGEFGNFVKDSGYSQRKVECEVYMEGEWKGSHENSWNNPGFSQTDNHPVVCVSWKDAQEYVRWLSEKTGETYRLLSESEWEYAARAGTQTRYSWGDKIGRKQANCDDCGSDWDAKRTAPVRSFPANRYGLYDVHGNVHEWVGDCWNDSYRGDGYRGAPVDGSVWESGRCSERFFRGGSWVDHPRFLRSASRNRGSTDPRFVWDGWQDVNPWNPHSANRNRNTAGYRYSNVGFRVARTLAL